MTDSEATSPDVIFPRYAQLRQELRDHPEQADILVPALQDLREQWKAYNGRDDLAELATGETEVR